MSDYPHPCDKCEKCAQPYGCDEWKMRFRTIWKQFNTYPLRQYKKRKTSTKFAYEHPDMIKRYLDEGPCKRCQFEQVCDVACPRYYGWWDARMEVLRKRYGGGK